MTLEKFMNKKRGKRNLEDFNSLTKEEQLYYDFTNDTNSTQYKNNCDTIDKYFIYKARHTKIDLDKVNELKKNHSYAYKYITSIRENKKYNGIYDPDSSSPLLQEIYKKLWGKYQYDVKDYMKYSKDGNISGDTMTSFATSLNIILDKEYTATKCFDEYQYDVKDYMKYSKDGNISGDTMTSFATSSNIILGKEYTTTKCFDEYQLNKSNLVNIIVSNEYLYEFMKLYHTLGNFIPVPYGPEPYYGFNVNRSDFGKHDYFHLTLSKIKEYYKYKNDVIKSKEILCILLNDKEGKKAILISNTKKWLDEFGNYKTFVKDNYLKDYDINLKKLNKLLPWDEKKRDYKNYNDFLKLQCDIIKRRTRLMLKELSK